MKVYYSFADAMGDGFIYYAPGYAWNPVTYETVKVQETFIT